MVKRFCFIFLVVSPILVAVQEPQPIFERLEQKVAVVDAILFESCSDAEKTDRLYDVVSRGEVDFLTIQFLQIAFGRLLAEGDIRGNLADLSIRHDLPAMFPSFDQVKKGKSIIDSVISNFVNPNPVIRCVEDREM